MTVRFRNDFGEDRVVTHIGYHLVPAGEEVLVPDEEYVHWVAGGWTPLEPDPNQQPAPEPPAAPAPSTPAAPPAPAKTPAAVAPADPEGADTA